MPVSFQTPRRPAPRHSGQSAATTGGATARQASAKTQIPAAREADMSGPGARHLERGPTRTPDRPLSTVEDFPGDD
jgi:hypothetical protein